MRTRSVLVHLPAHPFAIEDLCPDRALASMAAILTEAGHWTRILDYGTVETFERLLPTRLRSALRPIAAEPHAGPSPQWGVSLSLRWKLRRQTKEIHERVCAEIAQEIASQERLDFVLLRISGPRVLPKSLHISRRLRELAPGVIQMAACTHDGLLPLAHTAFDCLYRGRPSRALAEWAGQLHHREKWSSIPHIAPCGHTPSNPRGQDAEEREERLPAPLYSPLLYPALKKSTKMNIFSVEDAPATTPALPFTPPAGTLAAELMRLRNEHGARAIHLVGRGAREGRIAALAKELLKRGRPFRYSRDASIAELSPATLPLLQASGCCALSFTIDTGSQRLLDAYYRHPFSVTQIEETLRAAKRSGIHTIARFTYPSPEDDYHTRAETLRLIERVRPHAAPVALPAHAGFEADGALHVAADALIPFAPPGGRPVKKKALRERLELSRDIERLGVLTAMTPRMALMADLSGYGGREGEFCEELGYQFATGDAIGIATLVELINRGRPLPANAPMLRPFTPHQDAVGN